MAPLSPDPQVLVQAGFRYAFSLCHDRAEAKDLVQESWARLTKRYDQVERKVLIRAIRNLWVDRCRRPQVVRLDAERALDVARAPMPSPNHSTQELEEALHKIRPEEREAIFLSVVEGYTAEEIASQTDQPRNTVLSLIRRGKEKLRQHLEDRGSVAAGEQRTSKGRMA